MIELKSREDVEKMKAAGQIAAEILRDLSRAIHPGVSTAELDMYAERSMRERGATPAFKGYRGYPACICTSLNNEVVHGIPSAQRRLKEGDIISIDLGCQLDGFFGDAAATFPVGRVDREKRRLLDVTETALAIGIDQARIGNRVHDISSAIQKHVEEHGYSVVRDYVGHGIGRHLHEEPNVPNFGAAGTGVRLKPGMVLAIEPMVNEGGWEVETAGDKWTVITKDRSYSAHYEHVVAISENGPEILTLPAEGETYAQRRTNRS